jgi:hypothetical protein
VGGGLNGGGWPAQFGYLIANTKEIIKEEFRVL